MPEVRELTSDDRGWLIAHLNADWGGPLQARAGELIDVSRLPGYVAIGDVGQPVGVLLFRAEGDDLEVALVHAFDQWLGTGTALMECFTTVARSRDWHRVWLVTTNDNVDAIRFYQRRGWRLTSMRPGAVDQARDTLKRSIPEQGQHDIPMRDEFELEWRPTS